MSTNDDEHVRDVASDEVVLWGLQLGFEVRNVSRNSTVILPCGQCLQFVLLAQCRSGDAVDKSLL